MKTKLLKNEDNILFYAYTMYTICWTLCPTEVVSSQSNTYYCQSLSDDQCLFLALVLL